MPKFLIEVVISEHRLYEIDDAKSAVIASDIARQRAGAGSPLGLKDQKRYIIEASNAEDETLDAVGALDGDFIS